MTAIIAYTVKNTGLWPFVSYTAISYGLLTLRFSFVSLGLQAAAEILRFPVVAMATVTSTVWWLVLPLGSLVAACGSQFKQEGVCRSTFSSVSRWTYLASCLVEVSHHPCRRGS